jgi:hypothetical protein
MPRGRKPMSPEKMKQCVLLYEELQSYSEVGRRLDLAPNTVKRIVNDKDILQSNDELLQEYAKIKQKDTNDLLELVKSVRYTNIANNIVDILTLDNLEHERQTNGIRNLISLLGNTIDKTVKIKNVEIKLAELEIKRQLLSIKEKELELRITNPEAFHTVNIINDAPTIKEEELNVYN